MQSMTIFQAQVDSLLTLFLQNKNSILNFQQFNSIRLKGGNPFEVNRLKFPALDFFNSPDSNALKISFSYESNLLIVINLHNCLVAFHSGEDSLSEKKLPGKRYFQSSNIPLQKIIATKNNRRIS